KTSIVRQAVEGEISEEVTASFLQKHPHAVFVVDEAAACQWTAVEPPWLVERVNWTPQLEKRAVIWLARETAKPLHRLCRADFMEHHLHELLRDKGPIEAIRQRVFDHLLNGICTKPAGDEKQTILVFSAHPDDDVISMGGTLIRLADQGHDVHIAYQTSGNIAVYDHDALRHINFVRQINAIFGLTTDRTRELDRRTREAIAHKQPGDPDLDEVQQIKALTRQTEAITAAGKAGVPADKLH